MKVKRNEVSRCGTGGWMDFQNNIQTPRKFLLPSIKDGDTRIKTI